MLVSPHPQSVGRVGRGDRVPVPIPSPARGFLGGMCTQLHLTRRCLLDHTQLHLSHSMFKTQNRANEFSK